MPSYKVIVKPNNAHQAWSSRGTYNSESTALAAAQRLSAQYAFVRVVDPEGRVVWSG